MLYANTVDFIEGRKYVFMVLQRFLIGDSISVAMITFRSICYRSIQHDVNVATESVQILFEGSSLSFR